MAFFPESSIKKIIEKEETPGGATGGDFKDQNVDIFDLLAEDSGEDIDKRTLFRYGKRGALMRYGKRGALMRYGKRGGLLRYGKRGALFRYGKRTMEPALTDDESWDKRSGEENTAKRLFRWGKRDDADFEEAKRTLFRYGKRGDFTSDELDNALSDVENAQEKRRILRYGRDTRANKPHVPFRFGREE